MSDEDKDALKEELKAKLEAKGVEVDYRWGIPKMESVLAELAITDEQVPEETELVPDEPEGASEEPQEIEEETAVADLITCIVSEAGDGKIHDGKGGRYKEGDSFKVELATAKSLQARGLASPQGRMPKPEAEAEGDE